MVLLIRSVINDENIYYAREFSEECFSKLAE